VIANGFELWAALGDQGSIQVANAGMGVVGLGVWSAPGTLGPSRTTQGLAACAGADWWKACK